MPLSTDSYYLLLMVSFKKMPTFIFFLSNNVILFSMLVFYFSTLLSLPSTQFQFRFCRVQCFILCICFCFIIIKIRFFNEYKFTMDQPATLTERNGRHEK